jgi:hypothetical protein
MKYRNNVDPVEEPMATIAFFAFYFDKSDVENRPVI